MSNSALFSLLLALLFVCFNISPLNCYPYYCPTNQEIFESHLNDSRISILIITVSNDVSPGLPQVHFFNDFDEGEDHILERGNPCVFFSNFVASECQMFMAPLKAEFELYNPERDGKNQRIFWSVRNDAIYHSWDNVNWDRLVYWTGW